MPLLAPHLRIFPDDASRRVARDRDGERARACVDWTLEEAVARLGGTSQLRLSEAAQVRCIEALAQGLEAPGWNGFLENPSFAHEARQFISDCRWGQLSPSALRESVEAWPEPRRARGRWLAELLSAYEQRLQSRRWADGPQQVRDPIAALRKGSPSSRNGARSVTVTGFVTLRPLERDWLVTLGRRLERSGRQFEVCVPATGHAALDAVTEGLFRNFEQQEDLAPTSISKALLEDGPVSALGKVLFTGKGRAQLAEHVMSLHAEATPEQEAQSVAAAVRARLAEGVPLELLAVVTPSLSEDGPRLQAALERLDVPVSICVPWKLGSVPWTRRLLKLLRVQDDGFVLEQVAPWLEGARVLREAGIRDDRLGAAGGKGAYEIRLGLLHRRWQKRGRGAEVEEVLQSWTRFRDAFSSWPRRASFQRHLEAWMAVVERLGGWLPPPSEAGGEDAWGQAARRAADRARHAGERLREGVQEILGAARGVETAEREIDRRHFARLLEVEVEQWEVFDWPSNAPGVAVVSLEAVVGRSFQHLFLAGARLGALPRRRPAAALLGDDERLQINRHQRREVFQVWEGAGEERDRLDRLVDRHAFGLALLTATGSVRVSFSRTDVEGVEQEASPFVEELARASGATVVQHRSEARSAEDAVWTERHLRARVARALSPVAVQNGHDTDVLGLALGRQLGSEPWARRAQQVAEMELERLRFFSDPSRPPAAYSGGLEAGASLQAALAERLRFDRERPLSATALGRFGNCRFQGFAASVLHARAEGAVEEEQDARDRGSFWHKVLEELFPRLRDAGLLGKSADEVPPALLDEALKVASTHAQHTLHLGHPALWRLAQERARRMAERLLNRDSHGLPFEGLTPRHTEWAFGSSGATGAWREVVIPPAFPNEEPVFIEGKMDRVDLAPSSERVGIIDYKHSAQKTPQKRQALLETEFQLPFYLYAARAAGHAGPLEAAWMGLRDGSVTPFSAVLEGQATVDQLLAVDGPTRTRLEEEGRANLASSVHTLLGAIRAGDVSPRSVDCRFCDHQRVCRRSDRRWEQSE